MAPQAGASSDCSPRTTACPVGVIQVVGGHSLQRTQGGKMTPIAYRSTDGT